MLFVGRCFGGFDVDADKLPFFVFLNELQLKRKAVRLRIVVALHGQDIEVTDFGDAGSGSKVGSISLIAPEKSIF